MILRVKSTLRRSRSSFTLIELLIAISVAALVISGVFMSLVNSMALDAYNQNFTIAMNIARAKLEGVFGERPDFVNIGSGAGWVSSGGLTLSNDRLKGAWGIVVTDVIGSGVTSELKNIKAAVCWRERGGRIIGDCNDPDPTNINGSLEWNDSTYSSPCEIETAIAKR